MKKILAAVIASISIAASAQNAFNSPGGFEFRFGGVALADDDVWDDGVAGLVDFGMVFWAPNGVLGCWVGCGVEGATLEWGDDAGNYDTDILAVPFGASVLLRAELSSTLALRGEFGARWTCLDIDDEPGYYDRYYWHRYWDDPNHEAARHLDVDDTALAVVSLQLELNLRPFVLGFGGGYQFDLCKPDIEFDGVKFAELDLGGAFFFANLGVAF